MKQKIILLISILIVTVTSYGSTMTFHKGEAGTYNAIANELYLEFEFSGYDIGGGKYRFTIKQNS